MRRRHKVVIEATVAALAGAALVLGSILWLLWRESLAAEERHAGDLARALGERTGAIIVDARDMLEGFDRMDLVRCSADHLDAMQHAAIQRPHVRAIGHWRAAERRCGVGFMQADGLRPPRADRIYESGVIAWWPGPHTEIGGVPLFLMRYGDHDVAIDPRMLLEIDPTGSRQAGLWVEGLRLAAMPWDADLPEPRSVARGVTLDRGRQRLLSRFSHDALLPIDVVAIEPVQSFWDRHARTLLVGVGLGLGLVVVWLLFVLRYSRRQLSLASELRASIAAGQISVHYQPVIDLESGRCTGAEALARWQRDGRDSIGPDQFIPVAEAAGLLPDVSIAVLQATVRDLPMLLEQAPDLSINLNLGGEDLSSQRFADALAHSLQSARLPAAAIKLEITERALVNSDAARRLIREFRSRGHQIAVDDFGTGYSSLSYLQSFELDVLKIDKSFVDAIGTGAATSQVIVHVIEMAKSLGLQTVAEGVESIGQVKWLQDHGVDFGQGFLFSKALSASEFLDYVRTNRNRPLPLPWRQRTMPASRPSIA
jgi:sensor c-di-GMP phosphodiesterase-like protein